MDRRGFVASIAALPFISRLFRPKETVVHTELKLSPGRFIEQDYCRALRDCGHPNYHTAYYSHQQLVEIITPSIRKAILDDTNLTDKPFPLTKDDIGEPRLVYSLACSASIDYNSCREARWDIMGRACYILKEGMVQKIKAIYYEPATSRLVNFEIKAVRKEQLKFVASVLLIT